jgi:protein SCO1/2
MDKQNSSKSIIKIILMIGAAIAIIAMYLLLVVETPQKPIAGQGGHIDSDVEVGGSFELTDQNGNLVNSDSLKGHPSLIYFGFTYCPDICPTSLQKLTEVMNTLDKYRINVTPVFITIDPQRDTAGVLKEYLKHFYPKFIGLTGSIEQIKQVADKFKVYYARAQNPAYQQNNYMIDHSSFIYLMDKNGKYLKHFYMNSTPEEIIEYIRINCR